MSKNKLITKDLIHQIEVSTGLLYIPDDQDSNVCFATQNGYLRDEYKVSFTENDLLDFLSSDPDSLTPDSDTFWKWIRKSKAPR